MLKKVGFGVGNEAGELLLFLINPMEYGGGRKKLECAAHREALVGAVLKAPATADVEGDTQASAQAHFERHDAFLRRGSIDARLIGASCMVGNQEDREQGRSGSNAF
jgi:hypothetical protein